MRIQPALLLTGLLTLAAGSAEAQTYDFAGTLIDEYLYGQPTSPIGTPISGTFEISLANAQTVTGSVGSANWSAQESGGQFGVPGAPATVFDMSFNAPSYSYMTNTVDNSQNSYSTVGQTNGVFSAGELTVPISDFNEQDSSSITLSGYPGVGVTGSGNFTRISHAYNTMADFTITSVRLAPSAAPEIDTVSATGAVTLLLGGLVVLRGRRARIEWRSFETGTPSLDFHGALIG